MRAPEAASAWTLLFQLEITERFHPKELKQFNFNNGAGPYKYGKTNFMYPIKIGLQQQINLGNKGNRNGVSVTANFGGGLSLALLRPYLLGFDTTINGIKEVKFLSYAEDSVLFLSGKNVAGPGFGKGFNKIKVNPGLYLKGALRFDYGAYNEQVSAIEVGVTAEFYSKKIQQMAKNKEQNFYFGAYVALVFGKRK